MIGLELKLNGKTVSAGVQQGLVSVVATIVDTDINNSMNVDFTGLDTSNNTHKRKVWNRSDLNIGDEFLVTVKEIEESDEPTELQDSSVEEINELQLKSYRSLKKILEEKGLI